jgi:putative CocE/NonD family hydrolase
MNAPAYNMGGWFDLYSKATFDNWNELRLHGGSQEARQSQLIMGPWPHALSLSRVTGQVDFGADSMVDLDAEELRWFDYWLKGEQNGILDEPPLRLFIMGRNEWRNEHEWPLARTEWQPWYFHSGGGANTLNGDGALSASAPTDEATDGFVYDPTAPVPTLGGNNCCSPHIVPWGPYDQQNIEMRQDVLCYTSEPLQSDLEVTGPIKVVLYAATDQQDTDWTAKLVDVHPDGRAFSLCDGIVRARFREGRESSSLIQAGKIYQYEIDLWVLGNVFLKGHSLRVEISSSNFPRFDRNLNTGGENNGLEDRWEIARQTVHHSSAYPSHILLPVIPTA